MRIAFAIGTYPEEVQRRRDEVVRSHSYDDIDVDVVRAGGSPHAGLTPDMLDRLTPHYLDAFAVARQSGFDAVIPFGMYDLGVEGGKSLGFPVVGPCEAALHFAAQLGQRIGLVAYTADLIPSLRRLIDTYGFGSRIAGFRAIGIPLQRMDAEQSDVRRRVLEVGRQLVHADGAEVVVPMGVSQCPVLISRAELESELGVPVVDGISAPIETAATLVRLGLRPSAKRWPRSQH